MVKRKKNEVVVITGASAGVGRAVAREFAREGAKIGLLARGGEGMDGLEGAQRDVENLGGQALILPVDVADANQVEQAAAKIEETFGPIDIWVNDAMVTVFSPFKDMTPEEFHRVTEVTYLGTVYGTMSAMRRMIPRDRGTIVQVGSALSDRSIPLQSAYCGAKHGIRGFTDSIRSELIHDKSHVYITMVQLPAVNTPQFDWSKSRMRHKAQPVPPIYQPEVIAKAIVWAAHHKKRELYVGWPTVKAMWGNKFIAGWIDKYLSKRAYRGQQTGQLEDPNRPNNLWAALPGDRGAHGRFDDESSSYSVEAKFAEHLKAIGWGVAILGIFSLIMSGLDFLVPSEKRSRTSVNFKPRSRKDLAEVQTQGKTE